jgi:putative ABC transport system permease protein
VLPVFERYRTPRERREIYRKFLNVVRGLPGVEKAGVVDALPFSGENHGGFISASPDPTDPNGRSVAEVDVIGGEYLQALGVRLEAGRWFRGEEVTESSDAALVNEALAKRLWPNSNALLRNSRKTVAVSSASFALGKRICVDCTLENPSNWKRVVGVVSDVRHADLDASPGANVYLSAGALERAAFLVIRTNRPMGEMEKAVRRAIASVDPDQPVLLSISMRTLLRDTVADRRFLVSLLSATGCLALLMAAAGIFGVTAYTTSRRTQEIGIRLALGATPGKVHAMVFRQSFVSVAGGLAGGLILTEALLRGLQGVLVGLNHGPVESGWLAAIVVLVTAALACWIPARRATKIEPVSALRAE